ncbi:hypothetical protein A2397_00625 [Candidatus Amesbacteria bacterium RIFOXYB1_FULL_44_23]|uniref:Soluble ligand binding domain-containing protein n=1 Tax=Candidatus Amesbacteria bacterium RIFOXYB1_FULL_44_23 TaxID=1797263 RepID=A0A1F4ZPX9_9BACT|nr:MAG: hypothetical protein A2397_00625 [Candidatus Amesbacteria bacterium RIFOXYB1_FULL_44_23]
MNAEGKWPVIGLLVGLVLLGAGVFVWKTENEPEIEVIKGASVESNPGTSQKLLVIDVEGAVLRPGVYELKEGSRISDALNIAEGLAADADVKWVERSINKAQVLTDGYKLYIPRIGENSVTEANVTSVSNIISINSGSVDQLEKLPGVGPVTAGKIIGGRPFGKLEELTEKKIVGKKVFEQIKPLISL